MKDPRYKYANYVYYEGNTDQIKSFADELTKAGFTTFDTDSDILQAIMTYEDGTWHYINHSGVGTPLRFTSDQFAEALAAATKPAE